jgi:hypothetical protein
MKTPVSFAVALWAALLNVSMAANEGGGGRTILVATHDERELSGIVDARTDDQALWIRYEEHGIVLAVAIPWSDVESAQIDGAAVGADALKAEAQNLASPGPTTLIAEAEIPPTFEMDPLAMQAESRRSLTGPVRVRNLEITDVCLVNLDRDVEPDGFELTIAVIGDDGLPLALRGSLTAELVGERRPAEIAGVEFDELDRWSQRVEPEDFIDGAATYLLRFRRSAPEWEFDLLPDAIITAKLGAFGYGNYAASAPVVLRKFNPMRDNRQLLEETRFLEQEIVGRPPLNRFTPRNGLWLHWTR